MSTIIIAGIHAVESLLATAPERIKVLWVQAKSPSTRVQAVIDAATSAGISIEQRTRQQLDTQAGASPHQGVIAKAAPPRAYNEKDLPALIAAAEQPLLLVLDGVQDPHNLGACLRSADAAGVTAVIVPKDRAVGLTATVSKVASGAVDTIPLVTVTNLARTLKALQELGVWLHGTTEDAKQSLYQTDLKGPIAWVLGAEGKGMRRLTREQCDVLVSIPMAGTVPSLNVSVATAVCLFETVRQRACPP